MHAYEAQVLANALQANTVKSIVCIHRYFPIDIDANKSSSRSEQND